MLVNLKVYLNPISVFIFNAKIYSYAKIAISQKKIVFQIQFLILYRPFIFIVARLSHILNNV